VIRAGIRVLAIVVALPAFAQPDAWQDESTCVTCHEVEPSEALSISVPEWRESIHAEHLVSCDACHGGDPRLEDADESMSEEAGFLDNPSWTEMADYCGVCHEEAAAHFHSGSFGRAMREGVRVATCATCHMQDGHRIVASVPEQVVTSENCPGCPSVADVDHWLRILRQAHVADETLLASIAAVESQGIELADFRGRARDARETLAAVVHEFDDDRIDEAALLFVGEYEQLSEEISVLQREADDRIRLGIGLIAALTLLFVALLAMLRNLRR